MKSIIALGLAAVLLLAAKPFSTITVTPSVPHYGDTITVDAGSAFEGVTCYRGGVLVYSTGTDIYNSSFVLSSLAWTEGGADCVATGSIIKGDHFKVVSELDFTVLP